MAAGDRAADPSDVASAPPFELPPPLATHPPGSAENATGSDVTADGRGLIMGHPSMITQMGQPPRPEKERQLSKTNIYISGLGPTATDDVLHKLCAKYGTIVSAKAITDRERDVCKGYGFVLFESEGAAAAAVAGIIADSGSAGGPKATFARVPPPQPDKALQPEADPTNLYLTNLPQSLTEASLTETLLGVLDDGASVVSCRILRTPKGISRGVGLARLNMQKYCEQAIARLHGVRLDGGIEPLRVKFAHGHVPRRLRMHDDRKPIHSSGFPGGFRMPIPTMMPAAGSGGGGSDGTTSSSGPYHQYQPVAAPYWSGSSGYPGQPYGVSAPNGEWSFLGGFGRVDDGGGGGAPVGPNLGFGHGVISAVDDSQGSSPSSNQFVTGGGFSLGVAPGILPQQQQLGGHAGAYAPPTAEMERLSVDASDNRELPSDSVADKPDVAAGTANVESDVEMPRSRDGHVSPPVSHAVTSKTTAADARAFAISRATRKFNDRQQQERLQQQINSNSGYEQPPSGAANVHGSQEATEAAPTLSSQEQPYVAGSLQQLYGVMSSPYGLAMPYGQYTGYGPVPGMVPSVVPPGVLPMYSGVTGVAGVPQGAPPFTPDGAAQVLTAPVSTRLYAALTQLGVYPAAIAEVGAALLASTPPDAIEAMISDPDQLAARLAASTNGIVAASRPPASLVATSKPPTVAPNKENHTDE